MSIIPRVWRVAGVLSRPRNGNVSQSGDDVESGRIFRCLAVILAIDVVAGLQAGNALVRTAREVRESARRHCSAGDSFGASRLTKLSSFLIVIGMMPKIAKAKSVCQPTP